MANCPLALRPEIVAHVEFLERAANLVHASACGIVLTLLAMPETSHDLAISEIARESILAAVGFSR